MVALFQVIFQVCFYSIQPKKIEIVSLFRERAGFLQPWKVEIAFPSRAEGGQASHNKKCEFP